MSEAAAPKSGEFNEGRLWFQRKGSTVTIGVTSFAIEEIGAVQSVELPDEGEDYSKDDVLVTLDGSSGKLEVVAPATGVVQEINESLKEEPDRVSEDPLEEGWLVKLEIEDPTELAAH